MALDNVTSHFSTMLEAIASASFLSSLSIIHDIFSEFENKMLKVSKIGLAKTEHIHMRKVDATCPFRVAWLSIVNCTYLQ